MSRVRLVGAPLIVVVTLLTACGGGDSEGLSKEEFIARADAICADAQTEMEALGEAPLDEEQANQWWSSLTAIGQDAVGKIQALPLPDADRDEATRVLTAFEGAFSAPTLGEGTGRIIAAVGRARQYGFEECAGLGVPADER
jgi:hypothetical protein